jgi:type I restriction enzyme S subunit
VLVSTVRPNLNAVAIVPEELDGATASTGFAVLRPDPTKIEARYLYHWVRTAAFVRALTARATGASYPAVTENVVRESKLPLPPLAEQRRIAAVLDKADAIRRKRRESLRLLDEFLRSAFLEMFGDAVKNEKGWEVTRLEQVADIVSGVTKGRKLGDEHVAPVPYLRVANVQDGYLDLAEVKTIDATTREATQYRLQVGDILLTEGGDPDKLGRGAVWRGEVEACIHQNHVFRVRMSDGGFAPEYVSALLGSAYGKRYFLKAAKQTTGIASINRTQLGGFPVIRAPIGSQERYAAMVLGVRAVKERFGDATLSADHLFDSLAQRAFRGEL